MIRNLLASTALAAFATAATAADLPSTKSAAPLVAPFPVFSWTGFYIGVNAGGHWSHDSDPAFVAANTVWTIGNVAIMNRALPTRFNNSGFTGGLQAGYNWQVSSFVYGVEADIMGLSGAANTRKVVPWALPAQQSTLSDRARNDLMGSLRLRAGMAFEHFLVYLTGGLAIADWSITHTYSDNFLAPLNTPLTVDRFSSTRAGWTLGAGVEYALTSNWSMRAEYLYADFGKANSVLTFVNPGLPGAATLAHRDRLNESVARLGLNYKF